MSEATAEYEKKLLDHHCERRWHPVNSDLCETCVRLRHDFVCSINADLRAECASLRAALKETAHALTEMAVVFTALQISWGDKWSSETRTAAYMANGLSVNALATASRLLK